jgi:ParB family chromosome partitioning protein
VARRSGLGRGLSSLIPADAAAAQAESAAPASLVDLPVSAIHPNPYQPRQSFDEESLASLTASIGELGVLQPVLVRPAEGGTYELIAGERRWRAARRAGLTTIPAIIRDVSDTVSLEQALVENLHRDDLNALEEAAAYTQLIEEFGLTHEQVATRVGKSRAAVTNALRLFQLPPAIQKQLVDGELSAGHARALLGTPDRAYQEHLARRIVAEGLTVRAVEEAVRARSGEPAGGDDGAAGDTVGASSGPRARLRDPSLLELEELLADFLETRVQITASARRGKLVVEFADLEDLERIYRRIATGPEVGA